MILGQSYKINFKIITDKILVLSLSLPFNQLLLESLDTHLSLESISSSGFDTLTTPSMSVISGGASMDCTMNLCLLFSLGS
uniref:Uncharacterized protein n=1 Tax=Oncorhynchus kisutch TaxID=8019 RepID=A0A8C7CE29_ONCKI